MIRARLLSTLAASLLLAACASPQVVPPKPPPFAGAYANEALAQSGTIPDLSEWWRGFNDPVLDQLVDSALTNNLDLKAAVARIDAARAIRIGAASEGLPQLDLNANAGRQRLSASQAFPLNTPVTGNAFDLNASASWEVDLRPYPPRRRCRRRRRRFSPAGCRRSENRRDRRGRANVSDGARARERIALVGENARSQQNTEQYTRLMFKAGVVPIADVDRATAQAESTLAQLPALQLQRQSAIHRLSVITTSTPQDVYAQLDQAAQPPAWTPPAGVGTPADLLRRRPDVKAAEARVIAAYARVGVAEADLKPHLQLIGMIGAAVDGFSGATFARSLAWMAGAGASAPLFDGKRRRSVVMLRRAQAEQALDAYRATVLAAVSEVETSIAATSRNKTRAENLAKATSSARSAYEQINRSWRSGESAFIDTLEVQRTLLAAEDTLAEARIAALQSQASLMTALGQ